eukprot:m.138449 g.138449  ORF g.138449 m.138449 type:complete len:240 (-) comp13156_c0_seq6:156-875(-)
MATSSGKKCMLTISRRHRTSEHVHVYTVRVSVLLVADNIFFPPSFLCPSVCAVAQTQVQRVYTTLHRCANDHSALSRIAQHIAAELSGAEQSFLHELLRQLPHDAPGSFRVFLVQTITNSPLTEELLRRVLVSPLDSVSMSTILTVFTTRFPSDLLECLQLLFKQLNAQTNLLHSLSLLQPITHFCTSINSTQHIVRSIFTSLLSDDAIKTRLVSFFNQAPPQHRKRFQSLLKCATITK